jgi:translation initiation factor IF-3
VKAAQEAKLDLVEVAANADPPVCRIMDFTKFKYDQERKEREARKHQKGGKLKEIRLKPKIEEHDYQFKLNHLKRFLAHKDKVKVTLIYRGREMSHPEFGQRIIDRIIQDLSGVAEIEKGPIKEGKSIIVFFTPK